MAPLRQSSSCRHIQTAQWSCDCSTDGPSLALPNHGWLPRIYQRFPWISAPSWCSSCFLWYSRQQLKAYWPVSLWVKSSPPDCSRTVPSCPHRQSAKANTSQMFLFMLESISVTFWRCFLVFKWFNLCSVKLHGNNLSDSGFLASDEIKSCNWFSFSNIKCNA